MTAAACGASHPLAMRGPGEPATSGGASSSLMASRVGSAHVRFTDSRPELLERDGERAYFAIGARRVLVAGGRAEVADDRPATPFRAGSRTAHGWLFVTADGLLLASTTFLGPLSRVDATAQTFDSLPARGRVVLLGGDRLLTSSGGPLKELSTGSAPISAAAFASEQLGGCVERGGRALVTRDGGRTWSAVDLGPDVAYDVTLDEGALVFRATNGARRVSEDGSVVATRGPRDLERGENAPEAAAALAALRKQDPVSGAFDIASLGEDRLAAQDARDAWTFDRETGKLLAYRAGAGKAQCGLRKFGSGVARICPETLERSADGIVYTPVAEGRFPRVDASGNVYVTLGACAPSGAPSGTFDNSLCVGRLDTSDRRTVKTTVESILTIEWLGNGRAIVKAMDGADVASYAIDIETGAGRNLSALWGGAKPKKWLEDGSVLLTRWPEGQQLLGDIEGNTTGISLPPAAQYVSFADRMRGMAFGERGNEVWRTLDAGSHWEPVPLPINGAPSAVELYAAGDGGICREYGCHVGMRLVVFGWGALVADGRRLAANEPLRPGPPRGRFGGVVVSCHRDLSPPSAPARSIKTGAMRLGAGEAEGSIEVRIEGGERKARIEWTSRDERGVFAGSAEGPSPDSSSWAIHAVTRRGALLERCRLGCEPIWAPNGGALRGIPEVRARLAQFESAHVTSTMPLPDGGVVLAFGTGFPGLVVELDGAGGTRAWRAVNSELVGVGRLGNAATYATTEAEVVFVHSLGSPAAPAAERKIVPHACTMVTATGERLRMAAVGEQRAEVELDPSSGCVLGVRGRNNVWPPSSAEGSWAGHVVARADGTFRGTSALIGYVVGIECKL